MNVLKGCISLGLTVLMVYLCALGFQQEITPTPVSQSIPLLEEAKIVKSVPAQSVGVTVPVGTIIQIAEKTKTPLFVSVHFAYEDQANDRLEETTIRYCLFDEGVIYLAEEKYRDPFPPGFTATGRLFGHSVIISAKQNALWLVYFICGFIIVIFNGFFTAGLYRKMKRLHEAKNDQPAST